MAESTRMREFLRFCLVGGVGFLVDSVVTNLLFFLFGDSSIDFVLIARLVGMFAALQSTYGLHRVFTFRGQTAHSGRTWAKFMQLNALGAGINYVVFVITGALLTRWLVPILTASESFYSPLIDARMVILMAVETSLIAGTAAGLLFNYWANRRFVFRAER